MKATKESIVEMFKTGHKTEVLEGLPEDTKILGIWYNLERETVELMLESQEFEAVIEGSLISEIYPVLRRFD